MAAKPALEDRRGRTKRPEVGEDVGRRLRARREEQGLSLRELARRLGMSPSAISQIETGKSRPSVSTLYAIVSELGMSLDELFSGAGLEGPATEASANAPVATRARDSEPPASEGRNVQRAGNRRSIELETGVHWERLTPYADPEADFLFVTYDVDGSSCVGDRFMRHPGREYGLVLSGTLEVTVGFDQHVLGPGDSICFDSTVPHCLRTVGSEPVQGVWLVIGRHGDGRALASDDAGFAKH
jgi:transcriptional regulator with XRE-family HTH domain